ncbi:MAG: glycoside hydrolase family 6 protein, partial [Actinomycetota bacterium]|nr:glycoside hydrolase family 6 protein [Actinomycetota bacterium]
TDTTAPTTPPTTAPTTPAEGSGPGSVLAGVDLPGANAAADAEAWNGQAGVIADGTSTSVVWEGAPGTLSVAGSSACADGLALTLDGDALAATLPTALDTVTTGAVATGDTVTLAAEGCDLSISWIGTHARPALLADATLWTNPDSQAAAAAASDPTFADLASVPQGTWLTDASSAPQLASSAVAAAQAAGEIPSFVVYMAPGRDCGGQSAGGVAGADQYRDAIAQVTAAIGDAPAIVVVEPDSVSHTCSEAISPLLAEAVETLQGAPNALVYLDGGHSAWHPAAEQARRLLGAGVAGADGFALNVSNFRSPSEIEAYGDELVAVLLDEGVTEDIGYVVDTSRAGAEVPVGVWCNPAEARIGPEPDLEPPSPWADAWLWVKLPGESDGSCGQGGAPGAGVFWPDGARRLLGL